MSRARTAAALAGKPRVHMSEGLVVISFDDARPHEVDDAGDIDPAADQEAEPGVARFVWTPNEARRLLPHLAGAVQIQVKRALAAADRGWGRADSDSTFPEEVTDLPHDVRADQVPGGPCRLTRAQLRRRQRAAARAGAAP